MYCVRVRPRVNSNATESRAVPASAPTTRLPRMQNHGAAANRASGTSDPDATQAPPGQTGAYLVLQMQLQALRQQMDVAAAEAERLEAARAVRSAEGEAAQQEERDRLTAAAAAAAARAEAAEASLVQVRRPLPPPPAFCSLSLPSHPQLLHRRCRGTAGHGVDACWRESLLADAEVTHEPVVYL